MYQEKEEGLFKKYYAAHPDEVLKRSTFLAKEVPLYSAAKLLQRDIYKRDELGSQKIGLKSIGRIDLVFKYKGKIWVGEVKYYPFDNSEFWDALKCIGYSSYLNWQSLYNPDYEKTVPAVLIPKSKIKLEHQIVAGQLKVGLFGIERFNEGSTPFYRLSMIVNPY